MDSGLLIINNSRHIFCVYQKTPKLPYLNQFILDFSSDYSGYYYFTIKRDMMLIHDDNWWISRNNDFSERITKILNFKEYNHEVKAELFKIE